MGKVAHIHGTGLSLWVDDFTRFTVMKDATNPDQPTYKLVGFSNLGPLGWQCSCADMDLEQLGFLGWEGLGKVKILCTPFYDCCKNMDAWISREFVLRTLSGLSKFDLPNHPSGPQSYTLKGGVVIFLDPFYMSSEEVLADHLKTRFLRRDIDFEKLAKDLFGRLIRAEGSRIADAGWPKKPSGNYTEVIDEKHFQ